MDTGRKLLRQKRIELAREKEALRERLARERAQEDYENSLIEAEERRRKPFDNKVEKDMLDIHKKEDLWSGVNKRSFAADVSEILVRKYPLTTFSVSYSRYSNMYTVSANFSKVSIADDMIEDETWHDNKATIPELIVAIAERAFQRRGVKLV